MLPVIRHIAVRLWLLLLWGLPSGLWLLPRAMVWIPGLSPVTALAVFLTAGGLLQGLLLDLAGRQRILGLIREGELWEQAGVRPRAEERFVRAVRIFDSAMVSPWAGLRLSRELTRAMAGFYLTGRTLTPGFRPAAARYLLYRPEDETLAQLWLDRYHSEYGQTPEDRLTRSVLAALAEVHYNHPGIARNLVIPFLDQGRNDLSARRLYRSVLMQLTSDPGDTASRVLKEKIEAMLTEETLAGAGPEPGRDRLGETGLYTPDAPLSETAVPRGPTLGDRIGRRESSGTLVPSLKKAGRSGSTAAARILGRSADVAGTAASSLGRGMGRAGAGAGKQAQMMAQAMAKILAKIIGGEAGKKGGLKRAAKAVAVSALTVWLAIFLWSSLAHMLKSTSTEPAVHAVSGPVSGPFTIQVAAYLKQTHADQYVEKLKTRGVDAHVKKTLGGGKTWFLVRVSHFASKEDAAAFGRKLKAAGRIDDFFVSNT